MGISEARAPTPTRPPDSPALVGVDIKVRFEGVKALDGVDFSVERGEILGLIGPNGAGKTTLVNAITGFQPLITGTVTMGTADITGWPPHRIGKIGVARTFQSGRLFHGLTALENVEVSAVAAGARRREGRRRAWALLELLGLADRAHLPADALPFGAELRLGLARALAMEPQFLILDEPAAGLNTSESTDLMRRIRSVREDLGCGIVVIEHDMSLIMRVSDRVQVLDHGKTIKIGTPAEVRADPRVITAYLGVTE